GEDGRPLFNNLMRRETPQYFYAFDVLQLDGLDMRSLPLLERKWILEGIVSSPPAPILYVDFIHGKGIDLFRAVCDRDMEGIVAKHASAPYGTDRAWLKIKNRQYSQAEGRRELFERRRSAAV